MLYAITLLQKKEGTPSYGDQGIALYEMKAPATAFETQKETVLRENLRYAQTPAAPSAAAVRESRVVRILAHPQNRQMRNAMGTAMPAATPDDSSAPTPAAAQRFTNCRHDGRNKDAARGQYSQTHLLSWDGGSGHTKRLFI